VKNFESFQHYKDRAPPWIKLYNELLDDYDFGQLPDASKMHLVAIWLLASRSENKIPYDDAWVAKRINATEPVNLALLAGKGFILLDQELPIVEHVASAPLADCLSREREEGEKRRGEREQIAATPRTTTGLKKLQNDKASRGTRIASDWSPCEADRFSAKSEGFSDFEIDREAVRFRDYWISRAGAGGAKLDWSATWRNWVRTSAEKLGKQPRAANGAQPEPPGFLAKFGSEELDAWDAYTRETTGKSLPRNRDGSWRVPCQWPPNYVRKSLVRQPATPSLRSMDA
jgi:hypothetical protein